MDKNGIITLMGMGNCYYHDFWRLNRIYQKVLKSKELGRNYYKHASLCLDRELTYERISLEPCHVVCEIMLQQKHRTEAVKPYILIHDT